MSPAEIAVIAAGAGLILLVNLWFLGPRRRR
jgi:hypothetical protein